MLRVGLTGGIGSGKSTVAAIFGRLGAMVIDADQLARDVVAPGTDGLAAIVKRFGNGVLSGEELDRSALAEMVFEDRSALSDLEQIIHPRVRSRFEEFALAAPVEAIIVHEVPLLVEAGLAPHYHLNIAVLADEQLRRDRLVQRGLSANEIGQRLRNQCSDQERMNICDVSITNDGDLESLSDQVQELWVQRVEPFNANLDNLSAALRPHPVEIVDYQPSWPIAAQRLIKRLALQLPEANIAHIGSTSVPGLAAKDVIDLQVSVDSLSEVIDAPFLAAGFIPKPEITQDIARPSAPAVEWRKKLYLSADPGRAANIHVRERGSAGERYALLFPQWLAADPAARTSYEQFKRGLAGRSDSAQADYAQAKESWFSQVEEEMLRWAESSGSANQLR